MAALCPHCQSPLSSRELDFDVCPVCEKSLRSATSTLGKIAAPTLHSPAVNAAWRKTDSRPKRQAPAASHSTPSTSAIGGYAICIGGIVMGIIASIVLNGGSTGLIWLGAGVGAGGGVAVAQALGLLPKKSRTRSTTS